MSFGYFRSEVIGALLSTLTIWILTGFLVYEAVERCIDQNKIDITGEKADVFVITASCGVVFNMM